MINSCLAQTTVSGIILDSASARPVPFASIGIVGKTSGTLSNDKGEFEFTVSPSMLNDSLRIGSVGYHQVTYPAKDFIKQTNRRISLVMQPTELEAVTVKAKKVKFKVLGSKDYTTNNCTGFADIEGNWKGSEAAILVKNNKSVLIETFSFYVIQNKYDDSLIFRLNFYNRISPPPNSPKWFGTDWVGPTILKKAIIFKVGIKQGEFTLPLKEYNIQASKDFFISLESLMDEMEIKKFCYAGSPAVPSFFKVKAFSKWHRTAGRNGSGGGGGDFNVKVSYVK